MADRDHSTEDFRPVQGGHPDRSPGKAAMPERLGRYRILDVLGRSRMAMVFLGYDDLLRRRVAIKAARATPPGGALSGDPDSGLQATVSAETSIQEARKLAAASIPGVAHVYDFGTERAVQDAVECDLVYFVYEFVEGTTLKTWCDGRVIAAEKLARLMAVLAGILGRLHRQGLIHRDIKPANIMLTTDERPVLIDFGLALAATDAIDAWAGRIAGTLPYMSPEQVRGEIHALDGRTDLYSLGVTFYELLTGRLPFARPVLTGADRNSLVHDIQHRSPPEPRQLRPEIPWELARICTRLLHKDRQQRYQTADDLLCDLRRFLGEPVPDADRCLIVIQSQDPHWAETEVELASHWLRNQTITAAALHETPMIEVHPRADTDPSLWQAVIDASLRVLRTHRAAGQCVHLVPRLKTLCAFALGAHMNAQHDVVLYHMQSGRLHRIWRMDRTIKDLRSPLAAEPLEYGFFELGFPEGQDADCTAECLVVRLGANDILPDVRRWRQRHAPDGLIRCLTRKNRALCPQEPRDWLQAAAEIADALKSSTKSEVHFFMDGPAVVALMAGDALGPWAGRSIHLMQYDVASQGEYRQVLTLR